MTVYFLERNIIIQENPLEKDDCMAIEELSKSDEAGCSTQVICINTHEADIDYEFEDAVVENVLVPDEIMETVANALVSESTDHLKLNIDIAPDVQEPQSKIIWLIDNNLRKLYSIVSKV